MCILTSKLCYCMHRSPPKFAFCPDSIQAAPVDKAAGPELARQPCEATAATDFSTSIHHSEGRTPPERVAGNVDFCCSPACCLDATTVAERKYERAWLKDAPTGAADAAFARERTFHELCGEKRKEYVERLRKEQPCLFV